MMKKHQTTSVEKHVSARILTLSPQAIANLNPQAKIEYKKRLKVAADNMMQLYLLGEFYNENHAHTEAIDCFKKILANNNLQNLPEYVHAKIEAYIELAKAYRLSVPPEFELTISHLENALNVCNESETTKNRFSQRISYIYSEMMLLHNAQGHLEKATQYYNLCIYECIRTSHQLDAARLSRMTRGLARLNYDKQEYKQCRTVAEIALRQFSDDSDDTGMFYGMLSECYRELGALELAETYSLKAFTMLERRKEDSPFHFADTCFLRAKTHVLNNKYAEAFNDFNLAIEFYKKAYKKEDIVKKYKKAIEIQLTLAQAHMANFSLQLFDYSGAATCFKELATSDHSNTGDYSFKYAFCLSKLKKVDDEQVPREFDQAAAFYQKALKKYEEDPDTPEVIDNSSFEVPATCSRDPIQLNTQPQCTDADRNGSRGQAAGRRDLNGPPLLNQLKISLTCSRLAEIFYLKKQFSAAKKKFERSISLLEAAEDVNGFISFSGFSVELNKPQEMARLHLFLAIIYGREQKIIKAKEHYTLAIKDGISQTPDDYRKYILYFIAVDQPDNAIIYYQKLTRTASFNCQSTRKKTEDWYALGELYFKQNEFGNAATSLLSGLLLDSNEVSTYAGDIIECLERIPHDTKDNILIRNTIHRDLSAVYTRTQPPQSELAIQYLQDVINSTRNHPLFSSQEALMQLAGDYKILADLKLHLQQDDAAIADLSDALAILADIQPIFSVLSAYHTTKTGLLESRVIAYTRRSEADKALADLECIKDDLLDNSVFSPQMNTENSIKLSDVYIQMARLYVQQDNLPEAFYFYNSALETSEAMNHPLNPQTLAEIHLHDALFNYETKAYDKSMACAKSSLAYPEQNAATKSSLYRILANCSIHTNETKAAISFAKQALSEIKPLQATHPFDFAESCLLYETLCFSTGTVNEPLTDLEQAISIYELMPSDAPLRNKADTQLLLAYVMVADRLLHAGKYDQALPWYDKVVMDDCYKKGDYYFKQAVCLQESDDPENALLTYQLAIQQYTQEGNDSNELKLAHIHVCLAMLNHENEQISEKKNHAQKAIDLFKQCEANRDSIPFFDKSWQLRHGKAVAHLHLADVFVQENNASEAQTHYSLGLKTSAFHTVGHYKQYAWCCAALDNPSGAITYYEKALTLTGREPNAQNADIFFALGEIDLQQKKIKSATKYFSLASAFENHIHFHLAHLYQGDIAFRQKNPGRAQRHYIKALNNVSLQTTENYLKLGCIFTDQNKIEEAVNYFDVAPKKIDDGHNRQIQMTLKYFQHRLQQLRMPQPQPMASLGITLPKDDVQSIFQELSEYGYHNVYLRGSAVHALLRGEQLTNTRHDLDFIALGQPENILNQYLGYTTCTHNPYLYLKKSSTGFSIDLFIKTQPEGSPSINQLPTEDFTIAGLYCDSNGTIHDTDKNGRGLRDFHHHILNTADTSPADLFKRNPVCLLRAIKYNMRGFYSTPALQLAINDYIHPTDSTENEHLYDIMQKMLNSKMLDQHDLITRLRDAGLLKKLFGIADSLPDEDVVAQFPKKNKKRRSPDYEQIRASQVPGSMYYTPPMKADAPMNEHHMTTGMNTNK